jgi:glycosyltransferase involved in cell wall biosynthesis
MPFYDGLPLNLPPLLEILEWADRQQFDVVHCSTPGPMGLVGWVVSKMLRVPMLATYHTDFPAYVDRLTGDHRITNGTIEYMKWFYGQAATVFARSGPYRFKLLDLGVVEGKLRLIEPGISLDKFNARHRSPGVWRELGVSEPRRLLYAGRVSVEKGLPLLAEAFRQLCAIRRDTALIIAGDGPYLAEMRRALADLPAHFLGCQSDEQLAKLYASSDLFVFPSCTDTLGQVVMEAQACGLPALVSTEGGPREVVADGSGIAIASTDPAVWCENITALLNDEPRRQHVVDAALARAARFDFVRSFEGFWSEHVAAAARESGGADETDPPSLLPSSSSTSTASAASAASAFPEEVSPDAGL